MQADVFTHLRRLRDEGARFDLIVADPPKLARSASQLNRATRAYKDLNLLALKLLAPGGLLVTFSCSGLMTEDLFQKVLFGAALDAGRDAQVIGRLTQATDHPVLLDVPGGRLPQGAGDPGQLTGWNAPTNPRRVRGDVGDERPAASAAGEVRVPVHQRPQADGHRHGVVAVEASGVLASLHRVDEGQERRCPGGLATGHEVRAVGGGVGAREEQGAVVAGVLERERDVGLAAEEERPPAGRRQGRRRRSCGRTRRSAPRSRPPSARRGR